jgi:arsenate reductase-like glutaredoxin family protein
MIQVFGVKGSAATRAAERFFKERGTKIQFIDLKQKPMAPGEIRHFVDRFGLAGLLDLESKSYLDAGLKYLKISDRELLEKIEKEPRLLKLPFVRESKHVSIGHDEKSWKAMLEGQAQKGQ